MWIVKRNSISTLNQFQIITYVESAVMGLKELYETNPITSKEATEIVVKNHYLHRKSHVTSAFGLFEKETGRIVGVITYGIPASPRVAEGICGVDEKLNVLELTRLWIEDGTPKNAESFLIGNTLRLLDREIILSYSEIEVGHVGTVYQATNFLYLGLTEKRTNRVKTDGSTKKHNRHECLVKEDTMLVDRPRKHRYVYINTKNKRRRKEIIEKIRYRQQFYPKKEGYAAMFEVATTVYNREDK